MDIKRLSPSTSVTSAMTISSLAIHGYESIIPGWIGEHKTSNSLTVLYSVPSLSIKSGDVPMLRKQPSSRAIVRTRKSILQNDFSTMLFPLGGPENHVQPSVVLSKIPVLRPSPPLTKSLSPSLTLRTSLMSRFVERLNPLN